MELDDAALRIVSLRQDVLTAPQLDKEVFDAGDRDAVLCLEQDRRLVVGMLPESFNEVLPPLDGDADTFPRFVSGWALRALPGLSSSTEPLGITKIWAAAAS